MLIILEILIIILCFIALANISFASGKSAISACSKIALAFIKTAQVLLGECFVGLISIICTVFASSNHFVIDSYIIFYFSSMILIVFHMMQVSKNPFAVK